MKVASTSSSMAPLQNSMISTTGEVISTIPVTSKAVLVAISINSLTINSNSNNTISSNSPITTNRISSNNSSSSTDNMTKQKSSLENFYPGYSKSYSACSANDFVECIRFRQFVDESGNSKHTRDGIRA